MWRRGDLRGRPPSFPSHVLGSSPLRHETEKICHTERKIRTPIWYHVNVRVPNPDPIYPSSRTQRESQRQTQVFVGSLPDMIKRPRYVPLPLSEQEEMHFALITIEMKTP